MKIVYINEADRLSANAMDSLKDIMESVQSITRFFFLSNDPTLRNDIDGAIKSRCGYQIDLNDPPGKEIFTHCVKVLFKEGVKLESKTALLELIKKCYPDIRKIIGTLQSNVVDGKIKNIAYSSSEDLFNSIFKCMKETDIENLRKSLKSNYIDYSELYNHIYQLVMEDPDVVKNAGDVLIDTGEYMYRNGLVAIPEINFMAYVMNLIKKGVL
jgi:DNA polymerase III delta prime subunit